MKPTSLAVISQVLCDYFNTGTGIREIAEKNGINHTSVSLYISRFIHAFGDANIRNATPVIADQKKILDFSEEYLLKLSNRDFEIATGINPHNRYSDCIFF